MHDFKHPGVNNNYLINSKDDASITYNDLSVLESLHSAETFKLLNKRECNILDSISMEEFRIVRRRIIECILSTDMAYHSKHFLQFKTKIESCLIENDYNYKNLVSDNFSKAFDTQQSILNMVVHTADISNPTKSLKIYNKWVDLVFDEFFSQGDIEKAKDLPISFNCDRQSVNIPKAQIGFITLIVKPTFEAMLHLIPECKEYMTNLNANLKYYEEIDSKDNKLAN